MAYSFNPFTGNLDKVSVEDLSLLKLQDLSDVDNTDKSTSKILQVRADGKHEYVTLPNPDLTPYWKSDGSSTATGDWDLGDNDFSAADGDFSGDLTVGGNVGIGTTSPGEKLDVNGNIRVPSTTFAEQYGIIYKGTIPFIHDFSYGLNADGITPVGQNTFVGVDAGNFTMGSTATTSSHGSYNTAMGYQSLLSNTTGAYNNAMGVYSLRYNTTGSNNNAMGYQSLYSNTTGYNNNAMGFYSLRSNTTGYNNNAMGYGSLSSNTTGSNNNAMGVNSLYDLEDGSSNTGVGYNTGRGITYGSGNTILGASVTGLGAGLTNNIILANGTGAIKAQHDGTDWSLTGNVKLIADNQKLLFGAGDDASISYDGTDLNINPKEVGTGIVDVLGNIKAVEVLGKHKTADGTSAVSDGTYNFYNDGATSGQVTSMTIKDGIVTSLGQVP